MNIYKSGLLIVAAVSLVALSACNSTDTSARTPASSVTAPTQQAAALPADGVRRLSIADARTEFDGGKAVMIDVRSDVSFKQGHIKGAQNIPMGDLDQRLNELPKDKDIILYCSCPAEHSSVAAGVMLKGKKIENTAALVGGYPAWKAAGYPVEEDSAK